MIASEISRQIRWESSGVTAAHLLGVNVLSFVADLRKRGLELFFDSYWDFAGFVICSEILAW